MKYQLTSNFLRNMPYALTKCQSGNWRIKSKDASRYISDEFPLTDEQVIELRKICFVTWPTYLCLYENKRKELPCESKEYMDLYISRVIKMIEIIGDGYRPPCSMERLGESKLWIFKDIDGNKVGGRFRFRSSLKEKYTSQLHQPDPSKDYYEFTQTGKLDESHVELLTLTLSLTEEMRRSTYPNMMRSKREYNEAKKNSTKEFASFEAWIGVLFKRCSDRKRLQIHELRDELELLYHEYLTPITAWDQVCKQANV